MTLATEIQNAIDNKVMKINSQMPAFIKSYDHTTQTATVIVGVNEPDGNGGYLDNIEIQDVKVQVNASDSTHFLHIPLVEGTGGVLHFIDCDITNYRLGNGKPQKPDDDERHDEKDLYFVAGFFPDQNKLQGTHATNAKWRHDSMSIEMDPSGKIKINGASGELLTIIEAFMQKEIDIATALQTATVATMLGPQLLDPAFQLILAPAVIAMTTEKGKITNLKV